VCTLILGIEVLGPRAVLLAANRDEDPARPADPPLVLRREPRVIGGRDRQAGGTWLALRDTLAAVAMLNRRPRHLRLTERGLEQPAGSAAPDVNPPAPRRSRGLLALEAAAATAEGDEIPRAILARAAALAQGEAGSEFPSPYATFSLVVASPDGCWLLTHDGASPPRTTSIGRGWHVLTHEELDDRHEPRAAWLLEQLAGYSPPSRAAAEARLEALLKLHAGEAEPGSPAVCIHEGRMQTVSSARVWLAPDEAAYAHAEGRPCVHPYIEFTHLLIEGARQREERA
jgi:hypothetical protein